MPVTRGAYAGLMAAFYNAFSEKDEMYPDFDSDMARDCGKDDYDQFMMVHLGAMEAQGGYFEPMKGLTEERAASIMCKTVALAIPDFFGAGQDENGIMEALKACGVFDETESGAYQAPEKLTNKLALIRIGRLYDAVFSNELRTITDSYELFQCDIAAQKMRAAMVSEGKQGYVVNLFFSGGGSVFIQNSEKGKINVSTTGFHVGVLYGGRVYCNVFPEGLPEKEWIESFFENSGKRPRIEYLPV
jgi:hypothetical protein